VVAVSFFLIDRFVETDREQVLRKTRELAAAATQGDIAQIEAILSRSVVFDGQNYPAVIARARKYLPPGGSRKVEVWNLDVLNDPKPDVLHVNCPCSAIGSFGPYNLDFGHVGNLNLVFAKEPDGQWRITQGQVTTLQGGRVQIPN
jgi:hypothetical protein